MSSKIARNHREAAEYYRRRKNRYKHQYDQTKTLLDQALEGIKKLTEVYEDSLHQIGNLKIALRGSLVISALCVCLAIGNLLSVSPKRSYEDKEYEKCQKIECITPYKKGNTDVYRSFEIEINTGLAENKKKDVLGWANFHKREFDIWMFGSELRELDPPLRIGYYPSKDNTLSGEAWGGGFQCGHHIHVSGLVKKTVKTIFRHEIAHGLVYKYFDITDRWFHEGFAEVFEATHDFHKECHKRYHGHRAPFDQLFAGNLNDHFSMYRLTASMISHLIDYEGGTEKLKDFMKAARKGRYNVGNTYHENFTSALKTVYGYEPIELENRWRYGLCGRMGCGQGGILSRIRNRGNRGQPYQPTNPFQPDPLQPIQPVNPINPIDDVPPVPEPKDPTTPTQPDKPLPPAPVIKPGPAGKDGKDGKDGNDGKDGDDGKDGRSITEVMINTLAPNEPATARLEVISDTALRLILGVPKGEEGPQGIQGIEGEVSTEDIENTVNTLIQVFVAKFKEENKTLQVRIDALENRFDNLAGEILIDVQSIANKE